MTAPLSLNTQAILLLTAPLLLGKRGQPSPSKPLSLREYNRLAHWLREAKCEPADLLNSHDRTLPDRQELNLEPERLEGLLDRAFLLSQAIEEWNRRAIWVISRADAEYPQRLRRLREKRPPILYGCGNIENLNTGGLAVVGSRNVNDDLIQYTEKVGNLAAEAEQTIISGGARGIDQAAMRGAQESGGRVVCVLTARLERAATHRDHREMLMDGQLTLICPYDPRVGFTVWRAMERNKLIYSLADAALVVRAEFNKGGTWAGAEEHLRKHRFVQVYVRSETETPKDDGSDHEAQRGMEELLKLGSQPWPNPGDPQDINALLNDCSVDEPVPEPATKRSESDHNQTVQEHLTSLFPEHGPAGDAT